MIFLGIHSGKQSTKAVALDVSTGDILAEAQKSYGLIPGLPPGHLEQHPSEWIEATGEVVQECLVSWGGGVMRCAVSASVVKSMGWWFLMMQMK